MSYYLQFPEGPVRDPADFIGREREVVQIIGLLNQGRSVALIGPSGAGTSSLLYHLLQAEHVLLDRPLKTATLDLSTLRQPSELYGALLLRLGLAGDEREALEQALRREPLLLGLDGLAGPGAGWREQALELLAGWLEQGLVQLVVASEQPLAQSAPALRGWLSEVQIGPLVEREARALVEEMLSRSGETQTDEMAGVSASEISAIIGVAGGFPARLRRATELWLRSKRGAEFDWRRTFREEHPEQATLDDEISPLLPRLETEEARPRNSSRLIRRAREALDPLAARQRSYELEDISAFLLALAIVGLLLLAALLTPGWPLRLLVVALLLGLLGLLLPWLGLRAGWRERPAFQSYLEGLAMLPGMKRLLRWIGY